MLKPTTWGALLDETCGQGEDLRVLRTRGEVYRSVESYEWMLFLFSRHRGGLHTLQFPVLVRNVNLGSSWHSGISSVNGAGSGRYSQMAQNSKGWRNCVRNSFQILYSIRLLCSTHSVAVWRQLRVGKVKSGNIPDLGADRKAVPSFPEFGLWGYEEGAVLPISRI